MSRLSDHLGGPSIFVKRDDLTGLAFGGNKNRKLEFLIAEALDVGADTVITEGAIQSNHCLQTACCAARAGIDCELVLSGELPELPTGNMLLNKLLGVKVHVTPDPEDRQSVMRAVADDLIAMGKKPMLIPTGGSTKTGALGYLACLREIADQARQMQIGFDYLVHSTGSGGTQAGFIIGKHLYYPDVKIVGISEGEPEEELVHTIRQVIDEWCSHWSVELPIQNKDIKVLEGYYGEGYGIASDEMVEAVRLVAKLEGIFLDPVYNGKAMVGLIDLVKSGTIPEDANVLFLHSGGGPSIFSFAHDFLSRIR